MTQEEKAKRYDEALEKAKNYHSPETNCNVRIAMENLFPELKVSEDEKIRKNIISWLKNIEGQTIPINDYNSAIAWLEEQGEPKSITEKHVFKIGEKITDGTSTFTIVSIKDEHYIADDGDKVCFYVAHKYYTPFKEQKPAWSDDFEEEMDRYIEENFYGSADNGFFSNRTKRELEAEDVVRIGCHFAAWQKEQSDKELSDKSKQEWSEEDEMHLNYVLNACKEYDDGKQGILEEIKHIDWLKSLKGRVQSQPKQEWSEKDEEHIRAIISTIEYCRERYKKSAIITETYNSHIDWLKSIRPQNHWKPSDEQMVALDGICSYIRNKADWEISQDTVSDLYKLSEQLKKLTEE